MGPRSERDSHCFIICSFPPNNGEDLETAEPQILFHMLADQNICGGKNWSHKYYRWAYQQQQPVQWWSARLYQAHGEDRGKIAVICNIGRSASTTYTRPGQWSGQGCGLFFDRHHGEPVYGEMVLILIHIVGSYYTGIHRPPLSADWYQQWPKINYLHCVLHKIRTEGDGWKGDHYQIRTGPTDPRKCAMMELWWLPSEGS